VPKLVKDTALVVKAAVVRAVAYSNWRLSSLSIYRFLGLILQHALNAAMQAADYVSYFACAALNALLLGAVVC
jgi:hypothetical protein